jgi:hypothetical protein
MLLRSSNAFVPAVTSALISLEADGYCFASASSCESDACMPAKTGCASDATSEAVVLSVQPSASPENVMMSGASQCPAAAWTARGKAITGLPVICQHVDHLDGNDTRRAKPAPPWGRPGSLQPPKQPVSSRVSAESDVVHRQKCYRQLPASALPECYRSPRPSGGCCRRHSGAALCVHPPLLAVSRVSRCSSLALRDSPESWLRPASQGAKPGPHGLERSGRRCRA